MMAVRLSAIDIREVYFNDGSTHRCDGIRQSYRGMRVGASVQHDAVAGEARLVDFVDQASLVVALVVGDSVLREGSPQLFQVGFKRLRAVNFRFAFAQQVEVRAIDDQDMHQLPLSDMNLMRTS